MLNNKYYFVLISSIESVQPPDTGHGRAVLSTTIILNTYYTSIMQLTSMYCIYTTIRSSYILITSLVLQHKQCAYNRIVKTYDTNK